LIDGIEDDSTLSSRLIMVHPSGLWLLGSIFNQGLSAPNCFLRTFVMSLATLGGVIQIRVYMSPDLISHFGRQECLKSLLTTLKKTSIGLYQGV